MNPIAKTTIEALPKELFGNILDSLCKVSGSVGIINEKDIPVIMRFMRNFANTCKWIKVCVHDHYNTQCFIQSLADKFHMPPPMIAAKLNTVAARYFLWEHIKEQKYDQVYRVIQNIRLLASELLEETKTAKLCFNVNLSQESPNPNHYQTEQGYLLYCSSYPEFIATPFGRVNIYGNGTVSTLTAYSVTEVFIKRLDTRLHSTYLDFFEPFFEIPLSESDQRREIREEQMRPISRSEIQRKLDTKNLIVPGNYNVYRIGKAGTEILSEGELQDEKKYLDNNLVKILWKMLKKSASKKDPCTTKIREVKNPQIEVNSKQVFKKIDEVIPWAMTLMKKLVGTPYSKTEENFITKALEIDYDQGRTLEALHRSVVEILEEKIYLKAFKTPKHFQNHVLQEGILASFREKPCIKKIKQVYKEFINDLGKHWKRSQLKNYPDLWVKKSEEDYILYLKEIKEPTTAVFLNFLSKDLHISHLLHCHIDYQLDDEKPMIYMWIKKSGFDEVINTLQWQNFKSESKR